MTTHTTAELYAMFLESDWWIELSRRKRSMVGHCERCPATSALQAHHVRYPENWFDTRLEDLEVLCRDCHEKEHKITRVVFTPNTPRQAKAWRKGNKKRSWKHGKRKVRLTRRQKAKIRAKRERRLGLGKVNLSHVHRFRITPTHHYVNRGTSSN